MAVAFSDFRAAAALPLLLRGCVLLAFVAGSLLRASDLPAPFTIDLPFAANEATPLWLGHPETPSTTFATLKLPITPPAADASLLVTVFFQEEEGGFLRITWQGSQNAQTLSDNFYEGIGMNNQRSLLIPPETLAGGGTLGFQSGDTRLGIRRIRLEWLENRTEIASPLRRDLLVIPSTGPIFSAESVNGQPDQSGAAAWQDRFVVVPITDTPQRIDQGVEFSVQLDNVPVSGRLTLKETGLALGKHLVVWINQQRAGIITPAVPDLSNDGYLSAADSADTYVGWREGSFFMPVSLLKTGVNTVQFSAENDAPSTGALTAGSGSASAPAPPLAVKDVSLQLNYPPATGTSTTPAAPQAVAPSNSSVPPESTPSSSASSGLENNPP